MRVEILEDGTKVIKLRPLEGRPFYGDWLKLLLARGAAHRVTSRSRETGTVVESIVPLDRTTIVSGQRFIVDDSGEAGALCIGCGEAVMGTIHEGSRGYGTAKQKRTIKFDAIRIGGFVQFPEEEQIEAKVIRRYWTVKPVYREGIGCKKCKEKYEEIAAEIRYINEVRAGTAMAMADSANNRIRGSQFELNQTEGNRCLHMPAALARFCSICLRNRGHKNPVGTKLPAPLTPYIDIFTNAQSLEQERS